MNLILAFSFIIVENNFDSIMPPKDQIIKLLVPVSPLGKDEMR